MLSAISPSRGADDPYLLRGLVQCGLCEVPMKPARLSTDRRFYGCVAAACPRSLVPADLLDPLVWQAFLYRLAVPGAESTVEEQRQALEQALARVTVGTDLGDVRYQWRAAL
jgi:hypothetical protein